MWRSFRTMGLIRQAKCDHADAAAGENIIQLRGKLRGYPDSWEDKPISNTRKFYEVFSRHTGAVRDHDCRGKVLRLLRRREARKLSMVEQYI